jgi:hypothetical protein
MAGAGASGDGPGYSASTFESGTFVQHVPAGDGSTPSSGTFVQHDADSGEPAPPPATPNAHAVLYRLTVQLSFLYSMF